MLSVDGECKEGASCLRKCAFDCMVALVRTSSSYTGTSPAVCAIHATHNVTVMAAVAECDQWVSKTCTVPHE